MKIVQTAIDEQTKTIRICFKGFCNALKFFLEISMSNAFICIELRKEPLSIRDYFVAIIDKGLYMYETRGKENYLLVS